MTFRKSSSLLSTPFGLLLSLFIADASSANSSRFPVLASSSSSSSSVGGDCSQGNILSSQCGNSTSFRKITCNLALPVSKCGRLLLLLLLSLLSLSLSWEFCGKGISGSLPPDLRAPVFTFFFACNHDLMFA